MLLLVVIIVKYNCLLRSDFIPAYLRIFLEMRPTVMLNILHLTCI